MLGEHKARSEFMKTHSVYSENYDKYLGKIVEIKNNKIVKIMDKR